MKPLVFFLLGLLAGCRGAQVVPQFQTRAAGYGKIPSPLRGTPSAETPVTASGKPMPVGAPLRHVTSMALLRTGKHQKARRLTTGEPAGARPIGVTKSLHRPVTAAHAPAAPASMGADWVAYFVGCLGVVIGLTTLIVGLLVVSTAVALIGAGIIVGSVLYALLHN